MLKFLVIIAVVCTGLNAFAETTQQNDAELSGKKTWDQPILKRLETPNPEPKGPAQKAGPATPPTKGVISVKDSIDPENEYPILGKGKGTVVNIDPENEYPILGKGKGTIVNIDPEQEYPILGKGKGTISAITVPGVGPGKGLGGDPGTVMNTVEAPVPPWLDEMPQVKDAIVVMDTEGAYTEVPATLFASALELVRSSGVHVTPEGVLTAASLATAGTLILKFGRAANPVGAFIIGLGVVPVAASDYCSTFEGELGMKYFLEELSAKQQMLEAQTCPALATKIMDIAEQIDSM